MFSFLHTADWQIGKPYLQIEDDQKRYKLQQERINVINRIKDASKESNSKFILIAGDLFDSPTPSINSVLEVMEAIGEMKIPVYAIPGNHDYGALGTVWHRDDFLKSQKKLAPNFTTLIQRRPVENEYAVLLPCPLLRKIESEDPSKWIRNIDWEIFDQEKPRIVIAHGGVYNFTSPEYSLEKREFEIENSVIEVEKLPFEEIDYIALGDWHNLKQINRKVWYSGTPEPDRFNQGKSNQRGQVLKVEVSRKELPEVSIIKTGKIRWHNIECNLGCDSDLDKLENRVRDLTKGNVSRDLLRIEISGELSLEGHTRLEEIKKELSEQLIRLRIKGNCRKSPEKEELIKLTSDLDNPLTAHVALQLKERIENIEDKGSNEAEVLRIALCELYSIKAGGIK